MNDKKDGRLLQVQSSAKPPCDQAYRSSNSALKLRRENCSAVLCNFAVVVTRRCSLIAPLDLLKEAASGSRYRSSLNIRSACSLHEPKVRAPRLL